MLPTVGGHSSHFWLTVAGLYIWGKKLMKQDVDEMNWTHIIPLQIWLVSVKRRLRYWWSVYRVPLIGESYEWSPQNNCACFTLSDPYSYTILFPSGIFLCHHKGHSHIVRSPGHKWAISVRATHLVRLSASLKGHRRTRRIGSLLIEIQADYSHLIV